MVELTVVVIRVSGLFACLFACVQLMFDDLREAHDVYQCAVCSASL